MELPQGRRTLMMRVPGGNGRVPPDITERTRGAKPIMAKGRPVVVVGGCGRFPGGRITSAVMAIVQD